MSAPGTDERTSARLIEVGALVVVAVAFVGLFTGTHSTPPRSGYALVESRPPSSASLPPRAPSYLEWREQRHGPNARQYDGAFGRLEPEVQLFATVHKPEGEHERAVQRRAERRAYAGAPPTIPHRINPLGTSECVACHRRGATLFGKVAPRMSHPEYTVCTQCHVPEQSEVPPSPQLSDSIFAGLERYGLGQRAWPGAPPTIPHPTQMRAQCDSCHGPLGPLGLRTTHPSRQGCTQCHAPSAELDQRAATGGLSEVGTTND